MNLATIGFLIGGIVIALYAYTFQRVTDGKLPDYLKRYADVYYALAAAFLIWAAASVFTDFLAVSVLLGNALILLGSLFLLSILMSGKGKMEPSILMAGPVVALLLLYVRATQFFPEPLMDNGVLVFNTQTPVAIALGLIFAGIWLPANVMVGKAVAKTMNIQGIDTIYAILYALSTIAAMLLISLHTVSMVIIAFVVLTLSFAMLMYSNSMLGQSLSKRGLQ